MKFLYSIFLLFSIAFNFRTEASNLSGTIHIIGDSNAAYFFTNETHPLPLQKQPFLTELQWITYEKGCLSNNMNYAIHWLQGRTMYRVGNRGIRDLNIQYYNVKEGDTVVYLFGAIDVSIHIHAQLLKGRELEEIINSLTSSYIQTIKENKANYKDLSVVVCAVPPPAKEEKLYYTHDFKTRYPETDFFDFLTAVTTKINEKLNILIKENNFLFLNINELIESPEGGLEKKLSDGEYHLHPLFNYIAKESLIHLLEKS